MLPVTRPSARLSTGRPSALPAAMCIRTPSGCSRTVRRPFSSGGARVRGAKGCGPSSVLRRYSTLSWRSMHTACTSCCAVMPSASARRAKLPVSIWRASASSAATTVSAGRLFCVRAASISLPMRCNISSWQLCSYSCPLARIILPPPSKALPRRRHTF